MRARNEGLKPSLRWLAALALMVSACVGPHDQRKGNLPEEDGMSAQAPVQAPVDRLENGEPLGGYERGVRITGIAGDEESAGTRDK